MYLFNVIYILFHERKIWFVTKISELHTFQYHNHVGNNIFHYPNQHEIKDFSFMKQFIDTIRLINTLPIYN